MKFDIGGSFDQILSMYVRAPLAHKIAIPFLLMLSVGTIVFVSRWASRPDYQVLYSGLEEGDAASIVESLKEKKIGFRLRDEGRTIEVTPPDVVHEVRLELASSGLPKGGSVGLELFDQIPLGQTEFVEKIKRTRAIQGELERTIQVLDVVRSVRVHVNMPEKSVFVKHDVAPTASVLLKLKSGAELTTQQIKGITHLVSSSVERLKPENVSILDSQGNLLNEKQSEDQLKSGGDLTKVEYQHKIEQSYMRRIETMLAEVLGPGKAVARVTAEIDFSQYEKEEESYDPGGQVIRSERAIEEGSGGSVEGGVPGVVSNLTNQPDLLNAPDSSSNNKRREKVTNYELSHAVSKTIAHPGKIVRLSVAVLVDGQYTSIPTETPDKQSTQREYKPLPPLMLQKIENLVKQAVGFDATRGDLVSIENIRFFESDQQLEKVLEASAFQDQLFKWVSVSMPFVLGLIFLLVVIWPLVKFLVQPSESEVDLSRLLPAGIEELETEMEAERAKLSTMPTTVNQTIDIEQIENLLSQNSRIVKENPQQAALLIRYWLNEGKV